jgi:hypothetical protein
MPDRFAELARVRDRLIARQKLIRKTDGDAASDQKINSEATKKPCYDVGASELPLVFPESHSPLK